MSDLSSVHVAQAAQLAEPDPVTQIAAASQASATGQEQSRVDVQGLIGIQQGPDNQASFQVAVQGSAHFFVVSDTQLLVIPMSTMLANQFAQHGLNNQTVLQPGAQMGWQGDLAQLMSQTGINALVIQVMGAQPAYVNGQFLFPAQGMTGKRAGYVFGSDPNHVDEVAISGQLELDTPSGKSRLTFAEDEAIT